MSARWLPIGKVAFSGLFVVSLLVGCASNNSSTGNADNAATKPEERKPVTIKMFNLGNTSDTNFNLMKAAVEKKYPHITFEKVNNVQGSKLEDLIAAQEVPDLIYGKLTEEEGLMIDLAPLIKKYGFDVNRIDPRIWEAFNYLTNSSKKTLFVPYHANQQVLYYNKGLFDKFGVSYPKDGMTWDETYELTKRLARTENGVKYMGFNFGPVLNFTQSQLFLPYYDDKTGKVAINSDGWKKYYANFSRFYQIPGNEITKATNEWNNGAPFFKEQRVAMHASHPIFADLINAEKTSGFSWDLVSLPYFPEAPNQGTQPNTNGFGITVTSKNPDDAFLVIQTLLTDEFQLEKDRALALGPVLVNKDPIMKEFGKGFGLDGKNVAAAVAHKYAPSRVPNEYNLKIAATSYKYFRNVIEEGMDINTALRNTEEDMNKIIAEAKAMK